MNQVELSSIVWDLEDLHYELWLFQAEILRHRLGYINDFDYEAAVDHVLVLRKRLRYLRQDYDDNFGPAWE